MELKHNVGDRIAIVKAAGRPDLIGKTGTIQHVGPWKEGGRHPSGLRVMMDNDYIVVLDDFLLLFAGHSQEGIAVREDNIEGLVRPMSERGGCGPGK